MFKGFLIFAVLLGVSTAWFRCEEEDYAPCHCDPITKAIICADISEAWNITDTFYRKLWEGASGLYIHNTSLTEIPAGAITIWGAQSVTQIHIQNNRHLKYISPRAFVPYVGSPVYKLRTPLVSVIDNAIEEADSLFEFISTFKDLETSEIRETGIQRIPGGQLTNPKLETLRLDFKSLRVIEDNAFSKLPRLVDLQLGRVKQEVEIQPLAFHGLSLDIRSIHTVPPSRYLYEETFEPLFTSGGAVSMGDWSCTGSFCPPSSPVRNCSSAAWMCKDIEKYGNVEYLWCDSNALDIFQYCKELN